MYHPLQNIHCDMYIILQISVHSNVWARIKFYSTINVISLYDIFDGQNQLFKLH